MLQQLNDLEEIDLGILDPHLGDTGDSNDAGGDQPYQPDEIGQHPSDPTGVPPAQGHLDDACAQGGHTRSDGSRSAQAWECGGHAGSEDFGEVLGKDDIEWWTVTNVEGRRHGTLVPARFDLTVENVTFRVHQNATKHIAEYARSHGTAPPISSLAGSVEAAIQGGLKRERNSVRIGPWELGIDGRDNVIYHAVYKP
ncbi:hypothetical protein [Haloechinothrix sp. LS1_15]|uniref:hypothetical protein n=1 Tax=Haloechinothrix sp. LS1_15 TaxID=2652248 RepID=UPI00294B0DEF|nr:hypothetical protein [Haloechinothrix sp. LS1_15]